MKILILSQALPNYQELVDITWTNQREYAARHGYTFHSHMGVYCALGYDYQRIQMIYDILFKDRLGQHYDAIWWLGTDAMVVNHTRRIEEFIKEDGKSLRVCLDINGLNNDSFIIHNTEWSRRWLQMTLDSEPQYRDDCWLSQRCWQHKLPQNEPDGTPWRDGIEILPHTDHKGINSYDYREYQWPESTPGHIQRGDIVFHAPGMNLAQRLTKFRSEWLKGYIIK